MVIPLAQWLLAVAVHLLQAFDSLLFEVEFIDLPNQSNIENLKSQISNLKSELACFIF